MSLYESSGELYAFDEISLRKIFVLVSACIPLVAFDGMSTVAPARYLRNVMSQTSSGFLATKLFHNGLASRSYRSRHGSSSVRADAFSCTVRVRLLVGGKFPKQ
jgi:hypothetical protein